MKIEIVPEARKTKKEAGGTDWMFQWVFDTIFGSLSSFVEGVTKSVADGVDAIVDRVVKRAALTVLVVFGFFFLLQGFAKILNVLYGLPGLGDTVIGFLVLSAALIFSIVWKRPQ